jgi:hypothetical protein
VENPLLQLCNAENEKRNGESRRGIAFKRKVDCKNQENKMNGRFSFEMASNVAKPSRRVSALAAVSCSTASFSTRSIACFSAIQRARVLFILLSQNGTRRVSRYQLFSWGDSPRLNLRGTQDNVYNNCGVCVQRLGKWAVWLHMGS